MQLQTSIQVEPPRRFTIPSIGGRKASSLLFIWGNEIEGYLLLWIVSLKSKRRDFSVSPLTLFITNQRWANIELLSDHCYLQKRQTTSYTLEYLILMITVMATSVLSLIMRSKRGTVTVLDYTLIVVYNAITIHNFVHSVIHYGVLDIFEVKLCCLVSLWLTWNRLFSVLEFFQSGMD